MTELRKCKECGKLFEPKGREQYCSEVHYRPCPICGDPVIAKYLSDPARKCDKCKRIKSGTTVNVSFIKPKNLIKPMSIPTMTLNTAKGFTMNVPGLEKPKQEVEEPVETVKPVEVAIDLDMTDLEEIPARTEVKLFCADMSGSTVRFMRKDPLCGWIPGNDYIVNVEHDSAAYIVNSEDADGKEISLRCASQISFFNYFRKIAVQR